MDLGLLPEKLTNHSKASLRQQFSNTNTLKRTNLQAMSNHFGELRIDIEYLNSVEDIIVKLKIPK